MYQITGIVLFKNEDRFLNRSLSNFCDLCDRVYLFNNASDDGSGEIARDWARKHKHVYCYDIEDPAYSHYCLLPYYNTKTWVIAVDGDEIYDPVRLRELFQQLREGKYSEYFQIMGKVLHCSEFDEVNMKASGYLARPSRSMTKLYNFSAFQDWQGPWFERLHGGTVIFNEGYDHTCKLEWQFSESWESCLFRCMHMVFLARSSMDKDRDGLVGRPNIAEKSVYSLKRHLWNAIKSKLGMRVDSFFKKDAYARGDLTTVCVKDFFDEKREL